jgi:hypothetical protein
MPICTGAKLHGPVVSLGFGVRASWRLRPLHYSFGAAFNFPLSGFYMVATRDLTPNFQVGEIVLKENGTTPTLTHLVSGMFSQGKWVILLFILFYSEKTFVSLMFYR